MMTGSYFSGSKLLTFAPENLPNNLALVELLKVSAERKQARLGHIALAWLLVQKPFIVPIPGTTQMAHVIENIGAPTISLSSSEIAELNAAVAAIEIKGERLPPRLPGVLGCRGH